MTSASGDVRTAEFSTGQYRLCAEVPDGIFSLAVEADEAAARKEHAAFADRCMLLLTHYPAPAEQMRREVLQQLWAARQVVTAGGLGYLGVLAGELDGRTSLVLLGIAAAPLEVPDSINLASLLAALVRHQYPAAEIEEFPTPHGDGVGIRRCDELLVPVDLSGNTSSKIDAGVSQALVIFPEAGLLGTVTAFCFSIDDIDLATVFTATIAHSMTVIRRQDEAHQAGRRRPSSGP